MKTGSIFAIDFTLFISVILLVLIGVLFIFSSGVSSTGIIFSTEYIKQIIWVSSGLVLFLVVSFVDYARYKAFSPYIYLFFCVLLLVVLFTGKIVNGSKSWIGIGELGIQPAEFTKIAFTLGLAWFIERLGPDIRKLPYFLACLALAGLPMLLILLQPDLGTAMVFPPMFLFLMFIAGARIRYLVFLISTGILLVLLTFIPAYENFVIGTPIPALSFLRDRGLILIVFAVVAFVLGMAVLGFFWAKKKYFYWIAYFSLSLGAAMLGSLAAHRVLKEYQMMRLVVFLNPGIDPKGAGWNIIQSVTAVGSGGFWGKGFLKGTQSHYQYLPQQSTDFIFSILAEEWGFLGGLVVFGLFFVIILRGLMIIRQAKDPFAAYAAAGIIGMIFFHFAVNIGMAVGIMPITGIPLFFLSYGGSSLWTVLIGVGLLMSFYLRRYRY